MSAPSEQRNSTTSKWPCLAAQYRGVSPCWSGGEEEEGRRGGRRGGGRGGGDGREEEGQHYTIIIMELINTK